jgi:hypothetical protein
MNCRLLPVRDDQAVAVGGAFPHDMRGRHCSAGARGADRRLDYRRDHRRRRGPVAEHAPAPSPGRMRPTPSPPPPATYSRMVSPAPHVHLSAAGYLQAVDGRHRCRAGRGIPRPVRRVTRHSWTSRASKSMASWPATAWFRAIVHPSGASRVDAFPCVRLTVASSRVAARPQDEGKITTARVPPWTTGSRG